MSHKKSKLTAYGKEERREIYCVDRIVTFSHCFKLKQIAYMHMIQHIQRH